MSCYICLEDLQTPVSLPCGHIFCQECLKRAVQAIQPFSTVHTCPTCRSQYHLAPIDLTTVPPHLRPHLTPSIRKVYLNLSNTNKPTPSSEKEPELEREINRLKAENDALKHNCFMWRKRAEVHSASTLGLLELSRLARDQTTQVAQQRDALHREYLKLKNRHQQQQFAFQMLLHRQSSSHKPGSNPSLSDLSVMDQLRPLLLQATTSASQPSYLSRSHSNETWNRPSKRPRSDDDSGDVCQIKRPKAEAPNKITTLLPDGAGPACPSLPMGGDETVVET